MRLKVILGPVDKMEELVLKDGSNVAVVGGGPAGSFAAYFLIELAERIDLKVQVDIFEPHDYSRPGPVSCNHCGGIISESLLQILATDGINLPNDVIQRGINSYQLHMDVGSVNMETPLQEKRIAAVHRGAGPRGSTTYRWKSFDGYLQSLTIEKGAKIIQEKVEKINWRSNKLIVKTKNGTTKEYDLVFVASGVNSGINNFFEDFPIDFKFPKTIKTYINEFYMGEEAIEKMVGNSMHIFLLDIPGLEFAAFIPKGEFVTLVLLGNKIDQKLIDKFLSSPEVSKVFPREFFEKSAPCKCKPLINIKKAPLPFADRIVFIGDCGVTRLYKDGIGAAYKTAKASVMTAVLHGISSADFEKHYLPYYKKINSDNLVGKFIFFFTIFVQKLKFVRRGILRMVMKEQKLEEGSREMTEVLWDMFSGSATYKDIFLRTLHPRFLGQLFMNLACSVFK